MNELVQSHPDYSVDSVTRHLYRYYYSFTRLPEIIRLSEKMVRQSWLKLVGVFWSDCDNIGP